MSTQASSTQVHEAPSSTKRTLKGQKERTGLAHVLTSALLCIIARPLHAYQQRGVILTNQDHRLILHQKLAASWQDISAGRPRNCYSARRSKGGSFMRIHNFCVDAKGATQSVPASPYRSRTSMAKPVCPRLPSPKFAVRSSFRSNRRVP
jgi:hypothetical protein